MPICKGARLKIERANHHIAELESQVEVLKERLTVAAHVDASSGLEYIKADFATLEDHGAFDRLPLVIGDAIHNLKCALDHVWLDTVQRLIPAGDWERTKFPVYPTPELLERELRKLRLHISAPGFLTLFVSKVKPYEGGDFAIRSVHLVDLGDKHRLLTPVLHYSSIGGIRLEQNGQVHAGSTLATTYRPPLYVGPFEQGIHIKDPGRADFGVVFQDGNRKGETRDVDTIRIYAHYIAQTVGLLEDHVEP